MKRPAWMLQRLTRSRDGFALVVVLWITTLLAVLAAAFANSMATESRATLNMVEAVRVRTLADAAVNKGISRLLRRAAGLKTRADGVPGAFAFDGAELTVAIFDENGKIDLNTAPDELLAGLLITVGIESAKIDAVVDAIADWRDEDDLRRLNGAELDDYEAAGRKFVPSNVPFRSVAELQQVMGVSREIFEKLEPLVTVHSFARTINPATAPRDVLLSIPNVNLTEVEALLAAREEDVYNPLQVELPVLTGVADWLSGEDGPVYTVRGTARLPSATAAVREVVVWLPAEGDTPYWVLDTRNRRVIQPVTKEEE